MLLLIFTNQYFLSSFYSVNRLVRTSLLKQLDPLGPIASQGRYVPVFIRKPIITCDFPVGRGSRPVLPSGYAHEYLNQGVIF